MNHRLGAVTLLCCALASTAACTPAERNSGATPDSNASQPDRIAPLVTPAPDVPPRPVEGVPKPVEVGLGPALRAGGGAPPKYADVDWPHIRVDLNNRIVEIDAVSGVNRGFLEQVICLHGTRMHETVVVTSARPSHIHAALLLIGLEPGAPGSWRLDPDDPEGKRWIVDQPQGDRVRITIEVVSEEEGSGVGDRGSGIEDRNSRPQAASREPQAEEIPVRRWIRDFHTKELLPDKPWLFAGSLMARNHLGEEVYVADHSGSIAGLVTFGDELLAWREVLPDQEAVHPLEWEANTDVMPEPLTPVIVRLRPWE